MLRTKDIFYFHSLSDVTSCLQITENAPPFQFVESGAPLTAMILPEHHPVITGNKTQQQANFKKKTFVCTDCSTVHIFLPTSICMQILSPRTSNACSRSWPLVFFSSKFLQKNCCCEGRFTSYFISFQILPTMFLQFCN